MHISERTDFALAAPIVVSPRDAGPTSAAAFACFKAGDRGRALPRDIDSLATMRQDCDGRSRSNALSWLKSERDAAGGDHGFRGVVGAQEPPGGHFGGTPLRLDDAH
jgi:hypothetical protein